MARQRHAPQSRSGGNSNMATTLTPEQIQALLAKGRSRGDYETFLREFVNSGEGGWLVPLDSGPFAGKTAKQVKTSFDNARKRTDDEGKLKVTGGNAVKVIVSDDQAYLINTAIPAEA